MPCECRREKCCRPVDIGMNGTLLKVDKGSNFKNIIPIDREILAVQIARKANFEAKYQMKDYVKLEENVGACEAFKKAKANAWFLKMMKEAKTAWDLSKDALKKLKELKNDDQQKKKKLKELKKE